MLIKKYDTFSSVQTYSAGNTTAIKNTLLSILSDNYVVIENAECFSDNTLLELVENSNQKEK